MTTTTNTSALHYGFGSKGGYAAGYWYLFWSDGTNIKYSSTSDQDAAPATFSAGTTVKAGADGSHFQVIFRDPYVYVVSVSPDSNPIKFRRGLCSGGSISWDTEVTAASGTQMRVTSIDITDAGNVLIGYYADTHGYVTRNDNVNGTWSTTSGYPKQLDAGGAGADDGPSVNMVVKVLDLGSGNWLGMFAGKTGGNVFERYWNGSTLATTAQVTNLLVSAVHRWDARAVGSTVFFAWNAQDTVFNIYRRTRTSGTWGTSVEIEDNCNYDDVPAVSCNKDTGDVFICWQSFPTSTHVYYVKYTYSAGTWGSVVDAVTESGLPNNYQTVGLSQAMNNSVLFFYLSGSGSPYLLDNLRIESLTLSTSSGGAGPSGGIAIGGLLII